MDISFIIPAFNAAKTIFRAIDSIFALGLDINYEIIVIDDCSTDNTLEVVNNIRKQHSNITLLQQRQNHRQGAARNIGIKNASGNYIMFVDADDVVETGLIQAINQANSSRVDILFCNYVWMHSEMKKQRMQLPINDGSIYNGKEFCEKYYDTSVNTCPISYLWKRLFLINTGIEFVADRRMEDFDFIETNLFKASTVGYSNAVIYRVMEYQNLNSTTHSFSFDTEADWVHVAYRRIKFADSIANESPSFSERITKQSREFVRCRFTFRNLLHLPYGEIDKFFDRIGTEERKYLYQKGHWSLFINLCLTCPKIVVSFYNFEKKLSQYYHKWPTL